MIYIQSQIEEMPEKTSEQESKKPEPFGGGIPFPGKNVSAGQAFGIVKYRMDDPTVPIWAKVRSIEKVAGFPTLNGITKDELQKCLQWLFHYFDFDVEI